MLNDLDPATLSKIYIACGYTDLRYGIDGLASTVKAQFDLKHEARYNNTAKTVLNFRSPNEIVEEYFLKCNRCLYS